MASVAPTVGYRRLPGVQRQSARSATDREQRLLIGSCGGTPAKIANILLAPQTKAGRQPRAAALSCLTSSELILVVGVNPCARSNWRRARWAARSSTPSDLTAYPSFASATWQRARGTIRRRACRVREGRFGRVRARRNVVRPWTPTIDAACPARQARLRTLCQAPTLGWRGRCLPRWAQGPRPCCTPRSALGAHTGRLARRILQERPCSRKPTGDREPLKREAASDAAPSAAEAHCRRFPRRAPPRLR